MNDSERPWRIALLAHSTNPRGGVVHTLELADSLTRLGHEAVVHAPDASGRGFFRAPLTPAVTLMASPSSGGVAAMVEARIADFMRHFERAEHRRFDIYHAQDPISANALATLKTRGLIRRFARTVHHLDSFADPRLQAWQQRGIETADELFVVSALWQQRLASEFGRSATIVGNGVDTERFTPGRGRLDRDLRDHYRLGAGPILLCVGGLEERKNSLRIVESFRQILTMRPESRLVIAGGASLLDHDGYRRDVQKLLAADGALAKAVMRLGPVPDAHMPALYRLADALVFPSVSEGFGLVVLEAMASGLPVVTSRIAPFTEYLHDDDVVWCDPLSVGSIANAIAMALAEPLRGRLAQRGVLLARQYDWRNTARAHFPIYRALQEVEHA